jgi:hypothetical protein
MGKLVAGAEGVASMKERRAVQPPRPLAARLVTVAGLIQGVAGWTVLLVVAGLFARTPSAWIALAIVYPFGLVPLLLLVAGHWRQRRPPP